MIVDEVKGVFASAPVWQVSEVVYIDFEFRHFVSGAFFEPK